MYNLELRQNEIDVLKYRRSGMTFRQCSEKLGHKHQQQTQELYYTTVSKLRVWNDLNLHNKELLRAAKKLGKDQKWLLSLYAMMRHNGIAYRWKKMDDEEILDIPGFGITYVEFFRVARDLNEVL